MLVLCVFLHVFRANDYFFCLPHCDRVFLFISLLNFFIISLDFHCGFDVLVEEKQPPLTFYCTGTILSLQYILKKLGVVTRKTSAAFAQKGYILRHCAKASPVIHSMPPLVSVIV